MFSSVGQSPARGDNHHVGRQLLGTLVGDHPPERAGVLSRCLHEPCLTVAAQRHHITVGAFCMNPGMLMVERAMALPNLKHFVLSNRCYGSTNELPLHFPEHVDYAAMARAAGVERVYGFATVEGLGQALDEILGVPGYVFVVLDVEPLRRQLPSPPLDGPELKFRFGRYLERTLGRRIFDEPLHGNASSPSST